MIVFRKEKACDAHAILHKYEVEKPFRKLIKSMYYNNYAYHRIDYRSILYQM